ncbi:uncharacterized protein [Oryza sativa Japonica Group]|uniref:Expressed protein n=2 Tax=Oryza sativa subsp. japonica TaxID=39947 RepID=Q2R9Q5_ORYSJ|nr:myosin-11 isoform X1 [Oryza sativa Japonica Group]ABA91798.2 expressed protein [Oryza sativa Japonica Group]KAF2909830.1 hypothetical protein DAI22_11g055900 [Oryza sativa Japonica Group]BAF27748.1 Os11g0181900 [Oryza sativa Japonica Group]BAG88669.1 unnamed protein product [Oryza sativa Japonica Group]BAT12954.1 Os11g0181900 [Oryza sativa Japonica Group]|eukprot:NP_001065903.1 Os11g0181900 [Oryza sativa Japonica Group]
MPALQPPPASSPGRERERGDAAASSAGGRRRSRSPPWSPRARSPSLSRSPPSSSSSSSEDERENCETQTETAWMELGFSNSGPRGVTEITYLLRSHELKISELESKEQIYCNSLVQLEERIASLEYYKEKLLTRLSWTEEANSTLRSDNSKLKNLAYSLKERVDELEKDNFMLGLKMNEFAQEMERFQMQVGSTNTQMQDNLDDMAKAFESKERHVTFTQQKLADSINHHEERITTLEQDISQCTQHVQSLQVKVKSNTSQLETNNNDHHSLENRIQVLESTERQNASRLVKMEESIIHQHERTIGVEQDLSANITQHGQQIQTLQNKVQLQTNNNEAHLLENRIQVLESAERQNASRLVKMEDSIIHQHERIIGVEQDMSANITQHGQQVQTLQNKENDVLMKSFQSLLTCMVPFIVAFLLSMLSSQSDFGEYEKDLVIQVSLVCGLPGVMAMVFAHLASGPFWTSIVASLTLYFVIYSITLVYYAFIRLLPWSPWTRLQFYATVILLAIFLIVVLTMLIVWGSFVKKPKFTRWIASYFSCCPGPE